MIFFGNITCEHCEKETRMLIDTQRNGNEFYLLGQTIEQPMEEIEGQVECDLCFQTNKVYVHIKEGIVSAFLTEREEEKIKDGTMEVKKAELNIGMKREQERNLNQFHNHLTIDFKKQPFVRGKVLEINKQKWEVKEIYKRESIEKDLIKRQLNYFEDEYWYKVENTDNKETKWFIVTDVDGENAVLKSEQPTLKINETYHDVTDSLDRTELIFENKVGDYYICKMYQYISGVRLVVTEENTNEIVYDIFADTFDEAVEIFDEEFASIKD